MGTFGKKLADLISEELWLEAESKLPTIPDGGDLTEKHIEETITSMLDVLIRHFPDSNELKQIREAHLENSLAGG